MSAQINILQDTKEILISARLFLYGSEANLELGQKIVNEINGMWNEPVVEISISETYYKVVFEVSYVCVPFQDIILLAPPNRDYRNNFIRIENSNRIERSMMGFAIGDNSGHWLTTDNLGESTTAAHEFGHAFGLPHPEKLDYRKEGVPPIMTPRGTLVDSEYQWSPNVKAGEHGGTMKPIHRKVSADEVRAILNPFDLTKGDLTFNIGQISNNLYDQVANRLVLS